MSWRISLLSESNQMTSNMIGITRSYRGYDISLFLHMYGLWVSIVSAT